MKEIRRMYVQEVKRSSVRSLGQMVAAILLAALAGVGLTKYAVDQERAADLAEMEQGEATCFPRP